MQPQTTKSKPEKPFRTQLKRMWNALTRHPFMKLGALLLAFVFWAVVIASDQSLIREKTISNASVTIVGQDSLRNNKNLIVTSDLTSAPISVKMRVEVKQADYERASAENFSPRLDLGQITSAGTHQVKFTAAYQSLGTVVSFEPESYEVVVEEYSSRTRIPVVVEYTGESEVPLWTSKPTLDPDQVMVSGPKSLVDRVRSAVVTLPLSSLSPERPYESISSLLELRDADGNAVSSPLLRITIGESVSVDSAVIAVNVYPMVEVPVSVESAVIGTPAHGYTLGEIRITPATVLVAADQEVLDTLDTLHVTTPIDISGDSVSQVATSTLRGVSGLANMTVGDVIIEADIIPATHVHTYNDIPIAVMNVGAGLAYVLSDSAMSVIVSGDYDSVESLDTDSLHLVVDAKGLSAGEHTVDVTLIADGTDTYAYTLEMPQINLTLTGAQENME